MTQQDEARAAAVASWRERAVERSLRTARAKAVSRSDRFIHTAVELLSETGRTDFTVQELVERSKTSLRSFYQHFGSKDELLLALFEEVIRTTSAEWREEVEDLDAVAGLRLLVVRLYEQSTDTSMGGISRALTAYHLQLAESRPSDYARVLGPLKELIVDLVRTGVADGQFRADLDVETLAVILMQTLVASTHMHALGAHLTGEPLEAERVWAFCLGGLTAPTLPAAPTSRKARATR